MVRVFTGEGCAYCPQLKNYLKKKNIEFQEFDRTSPEYAELSKKHGYIATVPVTEVDDRIVVGINMPALTSLLSAV